MKAVVNIKLGVFKKKKQGVKIFHIQDKDK